VDEEKRAYGCVFCVTGKERAAAHYIEHAFADVRVIVPRQIKLRTIAGKMYTEEAILFPGYIFIDAPASMETTPSFLNEAILSVLSSEAGNWQLYGDDAKVVNWLFSYEGLISFSKAYREGERIRIISGPLKDLEGQILRVDKRNKSGQVVVKLCNREIKTWLRFEIVDTI